MAVYKELSPSDISVQRDTLNQLVDVLQNDISSSATRKTYQVWVSGGVGPGVTSSLFQTVFDQDFTLQTANPVFDMTFGLSRNSLVVSNSVSLIDSNTGKYYFPSQTLMMREKMDVYSQMAQSLLGNASEEFTLSSGSVESTIKEPLFIGFKRLFSRDRLKRETFAIKMYQTASTIFGTPNPTGAKIYTDVGSSANKDFSFGGQVSTIVDSDNTSYPVGLLYLDRGIAVFDTQRIFQSGTNSMLGNIKGMSTSGIVPFSGSINQLFASASMDDILEHICSTRFSSSAQTACTFQNETIINNTIYFCNLGPDEFNYSSNPTYTDDNNRIVVIDEGQEETQRSFTFITSIGGYDANDNLLWVAKLSRPVLKDSGRSFPVKCVLSW